MINLGRKRVNVVVEPDQRVVGGNVGDDGAKRRDSIFELPDRGGIVARAQYQVEFGAEIADRLVVAGQLLGGRQRAQYVANFAERAFDARQRRVIDRALARLVDAAGQQPNFIFDRFDRPPRHRLGDGLTNLHQLAAERGDRLFEFVRAAQRFDLVGDLDEMTLEYGKVRARRDRGCNHGRDRGRGRRCAVGRRRNGRQLGLVEFALARGDFCDCRAQRPRAERRRGPIGRRSCPALFGLARQFLRLDRFCRGGR